MDQSRGLAQHALKRSRPLAKSLRKENILPVVPQPPVHGKRPKVFCTSFNLTTHITKLSREEGGKRYPHSLALTILHTLVSSAETQQSAVGFHVLVPASQALRERARTREEKKVGGGGGDRKGEERGE
eukprot:745382-Hanusia_phi.AAC.1